MTYDHLEPGPDPRDLRSDSGSDGPEADLSQGRPRSVSWSTVIVVVVVLVVAAGLGLVARSTSRSGQPGRESDAVSGLSAAPSFSGVTLDGKAVSLEGYRGKPLILVFWATW